MGQRLAALADNPGRLPDVLRGEAKCEFTEGNQIALAKEVICSRSSSIRDVDLALAEALQQFVRGKVDQFDLGKVQDGVWDGLVNGSARDLPDRIGARLDMLHI